MTTIGVIGLGAMGGAVAKRLAADGTSPHVFDLQLEAIANAVAGGCLAVDIDEIFDCDAVLMSLPNDAAVESVITPARLDRLRGGLLIELSTILPATIRRIAERAALCDVDILDSPVSGGPSQALSGELTLMVGGDVRALSRGASFLERIGTVHHIGAVGDGKALKLVNNMMAMGNMVVAAEAFSLGLRLGLDPYQMYRTLSTSGGRSDHFVKRMPNFLAADFSPRFALRLSEKDLRLALTTAHHTGFPSPVTAAIHQVYEAALALGLGDEDMVAVMKVYQPPGTGSASPTPEQRN